MENLKQSIIQGDDYVLDYQRLKSEIQYLQTKQAISINRAFFLKDKYSFEGMWYQLEQINKGPLSLKQWSKIREVDLELKKIDEAKLKEESKVSPNS